MRPHRRTLFHHSKAVAISLLLALLAGHRSHAQDDHLGLVEYEVACMPCHGVEGRGDGRLARTLKTAPADLTQITRMNHGVFPSAKIAEIIDGRASVAAHGNRVMPVWGDRYRAAVPDESAAWVERRARARIQALVGYLKSIQAR
jgi:mono/diheme cytochrome c family protein